MEAACSFYGRQHEIYKYFSSLADYIWKLPRLLEREREIELGKLDQYFPQSDDEKQNKINSQLWLLRFDTEFGKILNDFPQYMGASAFIFVVSAFEYHLLLVCKDFGKHFGEDLDSFRGSDRGPKKLISFALKFQGTLAYPELEQVKAAIELRNCLAHANGVMDFVRNPKRVEDIINLQLYYPRNRRGKGHRSRPCPSFYRYRCRPTVVSPYSVCVLAVQRGIILADLHVLGSSPVSR